MGRLIKFTIIGIVVLAILMVFSTSGIRSMESWARERPDTSVGLSFPYTLGKIAYYTFRYNLALDIYQTNVDTWPDHPKNVDAAFRIAMCFEKLGRFKEAVQAYDDFSLTYADDKRADTAINRSAKIKAVQLDDPFGG